MRRLKKNLSPCQQPQALKHSYGSRPSVESTVLTFHQVNAGRNVDGELLVEKGTLLNTSRTTLLIVKEINDLVGRNKGIGRSKTQILDLLDKRVDCKIGYLETLIWSLTQSRCTTQRRIFTKASE